MRRVLSDDYAAVRPYITLAKITYLYNMTKTHWFFDYNIVLFDILSTYHPCAFANFVGLL